MDQYIYFKVLRCQVFLINGSKLASSCVYYDCRLYSDPDHRPKYNLHFVLSGGGKFNYFGTKGLLEEQGDTSDSLLSSADYIFCLDSLLSSESNDLYVHVSKPPREGSKAYNLIQVLNKVRNRRDKLSSPSYLGLTLPQRICPSY